MKKLSLKKHSYDGRLIVFEGTDGAGKTTLLNCAEEYIKEKFPSKNILRIKQPTDLSRKTKLFQKMMYSRQNAEIDYRAVQLLTLSDRIQQQKETIIPALKAGVIILCDRYLYTSIANMESRGYTKEKWFYQAAQNIIKPDLSVLAYIEPTKAIERIRSRPEESNRYFDEKLLYRVSDYFYTHAKEFEFKVAKTDAEASVTFNDLKKFLDDILR